MDISEFYSFGEKLSGATLQVHPAELNLTEDLNKLNDVQRLLMGNYNKITFPVIFKQAYGKRLDDVIRTGHGVLYLISDKMKNALEENRLTGWQTFAVKVLDKKGNEIKGYYGFSITGRCGSIDFDKSKIIEKQLIPEGPFGKYYKGLYIGLDKWDDSDFFLPEGTFHIIITKRAADIIKKNKFTNIILENLKDVETSEYAVKVLKKK